MSTPRLRLRPGLHVVRRDAGQVQVGLDPPHRVILSADAEVLSLIELLRHAGATGPFAPAQARVLRDLRAAGLLLDGSAAQPRLGRVALHGHGGDVVTDAMAGRLGEHLVAAGITLGSPGTADADLVVACASSPLPRSVVDPWLLEATPHLLVSGTGHPGSLRVGPLVEPGLTACVRCIDASEAAADPRRPLIVEQLAVRSAAPIDPLTVELALAWAARDAIAYLTGEEATTWSATVDAHQAAPSPRTWARHPGCGCCWDELPY